MWRGEETEDMYCEAQALMQECNRQGLTSLFGEVEE
jgi:hypothetical protein